ncbi:MULTISPECIES: hypothetical protein [Gordonia]|uniref:Uncharacterized protein n=1 Tax=Gordonia cholesterolivorans TaxID=559625 RepID=A0ABN3I3B3_9ACTN|nr:MULTISPECIES: hypothetical protein [Gordonia]
MLIRPTPTGAQVPATAHGFLASVVSLILGVAAHSIGGGHLPTTAQSAVLLGLALGVGLVRAAQVRSVERARARGRIGISATGALVALSAGQATAHGVLSLMAGHAGHGTGVTPGPLMLFWHALAVPAAAAVLFVAEQLSRAYGNSVSHVWRLVSTRVCLDPAFVVIRADRHAAALRPAPMVASAAVRGPPSLV